MFRPNIRGKKRGSNGKPTQVATTKEIVFRIFKKTLGLSAPFEHDH